MDKDKIKGILIGLAASDRNGGPIRMCLLLYESLNSLQQFNSNDIFNRYYNWWIKGGFDTGTTIERLFNCIRKGESIENARKQLKTTYGHLAGCNPAHRCAPIAMFEFIRDDQIELFAMEEANLTHPNDLSADVSAAVAILCRSLIKGQSWEQSLINAAINRKSETIEALNISQKLQLYNRSSSSSSSSSFSLSFVFSQLNNNGFAPKVLEAAIYFIQINSNFNDALEQSLQFAGNANFCPVLVGAIGGAKWGLSSINLELLKHRTNCKLFKCDENQLLYDKLMNLINTL
eukprot:TRINITY_DN665_c0_g1_i1.p1 TRINITY_DN665_c0_g1~~TRINITY_DN665_c0_g1_i1.p1  ORF type:complete len:290 (-),score=154.10 TRINITY_DN665_c0_g1_i1:21-890(-)